MDADSRGRQGDLPETLGAVDAASPEPRIGIAAELEAAGFADAVEIGRGGFGAVYRCRQVELDRLVAVKVLTAGSVDDRARFVREQQAMARLTGHPNILAVLAVGDTASRHPFLVMPYCPQGCLQQRIARLGRLPLGEVLAVGVKMAGALESAHRVGVVHRDVKPANILLTEYGEPALTDFGISRVAGGFTTVTGAFTGSPAFMAPEIISGDTPTAASDVYGLGATLFCTLTGHAAFERRVGEQVVAQFLRIAADPVPDLRGQDIPDDVAAVVHAAMARDPSDRPTAAQLGRQLQQVQTGHSLAVDEMALQGADLSDRHVHQGARPAAGRSRGYLPAPMISFVGRDQELSELEELLSTSRLVTLSGLGGMGKTTLSIQVANQLVSEFRDGVWLVELADLRDGMLLAEFVAHALGVRDQAGRPVTELLVDFLAPRRALVVLDNCEHIVDDVAKLVDVLLRDCSQLSVLTTSREVLGLVDESVLPLSPLAVPDADSGLTLGSLSAFASVALFVQRARTAVHNFALTEENAAAVGRICSRLEGLPLAIELAAARLRAMSIEQIADGLSNRYGLLTRGRRGAPTRQQTLSGCIGWSYDLCTAAEQQLWARLSVFAASFDWAAAHDVCVSDLDDDECLDLLSSLVDKSILIRQEQHGMVRFKLLETLREYGNTHLTASAGYTELRRRHAHWYERLLADAVRQWNGPDQLRWVQRLSQEMPNIREALQFNLTDSPGSALQMTANMRRVWVFNGMQGEGRRWLDLALSAAPPEPTLARVRSVFAMAEIAVAKCDLLALQEWVGTARSLLEVVDDPATRGQIEHICGLAALLLGDIEGGKVFCQRALAVTDDVEAQVWSMVTMGWLVAVSGDIEDALSWFEKGFAVAESRGDRVLRSHAKFSAGAGRWAHGEPERAEQLLRESLQLSQPINDAWSVAQCLEIVAWLAGSNHDARRAAVLMAAAAAVARAGGSPIVPMAHVGAFHAECERRAREELDPAEFEAAWSHGSSLSLDEAVAVAVS